MIRLTSIGVKKYQQQTTFHNDKATINWSNKSQQKTTFHNDKATIHWSNKNHNNKLPPIMTRLPFIGVTKISKTDYLP